MLNGHMFVVLQVEGSEVVDLTRLGVCTVVRMSYGVDMGLGLAPLLAPSVELTGALKQ